MGNHAIDLQNAATAVGDLLDCKGDQATASVEERMQPISRLVNNCSAMCGLWRTCRSDLGETRATLATNMKQLLEGKPVNDSLMALVEQAASVLGLCAAPGLFLGRSVLWFEDTADRGRK